MLPSTVIDAYEHKYVVLFGDPHDDDAPILDVHEDDLFLVEKA